MTSQPSLFERVYPIERRGLSLEEQFRAFHQQNPHVMKELVAEARALKRIGQDHYSVYALFQVLRWRHIRTTGSDFKLNNNFQPAYARWIMKHYSDLAGFFEVRKRTAA